MKIINIFKMNNWEINKFLKAVFIIQILFLFFILLENIGIQIPILYQIIAFIYLTFIPGFLILRILKMFDLTTTVTILYSVGISISSLIFIGFFMNMVYPIIGIQNPITFTPLLITISIFVFLLSLLSYKMDNGFNNEEFFYLDDFITPWPLFLLLIPFLIILGAYLVNYYDNNVLLMSTVGLICFIPILVAFDKLPKKWYPLAIFAITISLLFHATLISKYIAGYDIVQEYHYADMVMKNYFWDPSLYKAYNSVLSVVILPPIYSIMSNLSLVGVFKIIYPFILSLVPVGLYLLFKEQVNNDKVAFMSVFLFISIAPFFLEMVSLARQEVAELFLTLLLILFFFRDNKPILYVIFGLGLVVSHYALAFMYMSIFLGIWILVNIYRRPYTTNLMRRISYNFLYLILIRPKIIYFDVHKKMGIIINKIIIRPKIARTLFLFFIRPNVNLFNNSKITIKNEGYIKISTVMDKMILRSKITNIFDKFSYLKNTQVNIYFILLLFVFSLSWYMYVAGSYSFINFVDIFEHIISKLSDLLDPNSSQSLQLILADYTPAKLIEKYMYLFTQLLIVIGFCSVLLKKYRGKFDDSYIAFSIFNMILLVASIILPNLAESFNTTRFYQLSLFFLAPFFIIGSIFLFNFIGNIKSLKKNNLENSYKVLAVFLSVFLIFSSGIAIEFTNDFPKSMAFSKDKWSFFFEQDADVASAQWLGKHENGQVYAEFFSHSSFITYGYIRANQTTEGSIYDNTFDTELLYNWTTLDPNSYVYVRFGDKITKEKYNYNPYYIVQSGNFTLYMNKVYDSNSEIYQTPKSISYL